MVDIEYLDELGGKDSKTWSAIRAPARRTGASGTACYVYELVRTILGIILFISTTAHAQAPSGAPVKVTVALSDPARPVPPRGSTFTSVVDLDQVRSLEGLKGPIRAEQEQLLVDLITNTSPGEVDELSHYYFMLGELQAKQYRHWRLRSAELSLQADPSKDAKPRQEAAAAAEKAKQYLAKAVKTFKLLTEKEAFRNYQKMDVALFYYGYTLQTAQQMAEARAVYFKLIKSFPNSRLVPEAHLAFADHFFDAGDFASAETYYKAILKYPKSTVFWYAMYKLGAIHYHLQRFQEALETFFQVVQATTIDPQLESLNRAAASAFVHAYAEIGKTDKARAAFQRVDGKRAIDMQQLLADLYLEQGKSDKAIYLYKDLRTTQPDHQNACQWQYNLARATASTATTAKELELCAGDVELLKTWGRANGVAVSCASCAGKQRP